MSIVELCLDYTNAHLTKINLVCLLEIVDFQERYLPGPLGQVCIKIEYTIYPCM
jgi:hypothetical protein